MNKDTLVHLLLYDGSALDYNTNTFLCTWMIEYITLTDRLTIL